MKLKAGVNIVGIRPELVLGLAIADSVYMRLANKEVTVTSVLDGTHMEGSLHKQGLAADLRTRDVFVNLGTLLAELKKALQNQFQVILEEDHYHIEFDVR